MKRQDEARKATATLWGGEFPRRVPPQASDGSGDIRQHL